MGNVLKCFRGDEEEDHYPYYHPGSRPHYPQQQQQQQADGHGVASLAHDLLNFESASMVPEGLRQHVTASKKAQIKWYQNTLDAYKNARTPPRTPEEAAQLVATALNWIQRADLEGILEFYNFPIPSLPAASSNHPPSSLPEGVQFVLNTLPVINQNIGDGDGFTAYVATTDPRESGNVPIEVHEMVIARTEARNRRDYKSADALQSSIKEAGYKIIVCSGEEILARKYRIRMRGIDAPELKMTYGKESKSALVKLVGGKRTTIHVYGQDQFDRYVGDVYCNGVFIQEKMLKNGHAWHFTTYDKRPEFAKVRFFLLESGRERQELHSEGSLPHSTLRSRGTGEESSAMVAFRSTNGFIHDPSMSRTNGQKGVYSLVSRVDLDQHHHAAN